MSRDGRDDAREDAPETPLRGPTSAEEPGRPETSAPLETPERSETRDRPENRESPERPTGRPGVPMDRLTLPRGAAREALQVRGHVYRLRASESRMLATVGTFRVVRADDLQPIRSSRDAWTGDLRSLAEQGLVQLKTVDVNRAPVAVVVLTRAGKDVLEAHRPPSDQRAQAYHAGLVKPRELAHDAQLYRLYQAEAARIEADGGRITRVVLDYELKREYQTFLNRPRRPEETDRADDADRTDAATRTDHTNGTGDAARAGDAGRPDPANHARRADDAARVGDIETYARRVGPPHRGWPSRTA